METLSLVFPPNSKRPLGGTDRPQPREPGIARSSCPNLGLGKGKLADASRRTEVL